MDIPSISAALSSIKIATDIAKMIRESSTSLEKAELNLKTAELISSLADTKIQLADIKQVLLDRDEKIISLEGAMRARESLVYDQPYYWQVSGETKTGPYCQKCYDVDGKLVRLQGSTSTRGWWQCQGCSNVVYDKSYNTSSYDNYASEWPSRGD